MFGTKSLSSLKGILPPIHQPLPLNKRESQQLLTALTTSFRQNLDKEHGYLGRDAPPTPSSNGASSTLPPQTSAKDAHRRPTDRHVQAILSNPLFSYRPSAQQHTGRPRSERDPMDVFDEAVAKGLMTLPRAAGVLEAKRRSIVQSSSPSVRQIMATSRTAFRIIQWLRASGLERDLSFMAMPSLTKTLFMFMIEEGLEDVAWVWLERLMAGEGPDELIQGRTPAAFALDSLISAKVSREDSLDDAYACILRAQDMFSQNLSFVRRAIAAWHELSWLSTVTAWKRSRPLVALFDAFVAMSQRFPHTASLDLAQAHLQLHHPTKPSPDSAISLLQSQPVWHNVAFKRKGTSIQRNPRRDPHNVPLNLDRAHLQRHHSTKPAPGPAISPLPDWEMTALEKRKWTEEYQTDAGFKIRPHSYASRVAYMGIDTVQHLSHNGQQREAEWIFFLLRSNLSSIFKRDFQGFCNGVFTG